MNIGIVCYASVGGSGVVGTELAHALALRGHRVHLISSEVPFRWRHGQPGRPVGFVGGGRRGRHRKGSPAGRQASLCGSSLLLPLTTINALQSSAVRS